MTKVPAKVVVAAGRERAQRHALPATRFLVVAGVPAGQAMAARDGRHYENRCWRPGTAATTTV